MTTATPVRARPPTAAPALSLDARLAAVGASMTVRLDQAALAHAVDARHPETVLDYAVIIRLTPADTERPVAALLRRAQAHVLSPGGWSRDTGTNARGGTCLEHALITEARTGRDEQEARILLRQAIGSGDPVTHINRRITQAQAGQLLGAAAALAANRNL
ncbi:hypothetical protein OG875_04940 [Streptomyces sp. NBC_01498]|uniref:hypothetical protein n=1 Tax=Streptomyces sp. NBC_01498 TaxID=2975870 RepID=UPI002E7C36D1|nr:hypothetical protein [Streptomyces sp. NBC_01498]WTL24003.1 hypothetical protein OG875_04940 [Streptomyces sp. NBC_01498]